MKQIDTPMPIDPRRHRFLRALGLNMGLVALGALLFSLSFPSFISKWGWFPLAYVALVPVFVLIHRSNWTEVFFYGFFYGFLAYALHNFRLTGFHPLALLLVPLIYAVYFLILFPILKLADTLLPRYGYLLQIAVWIAYEYLRTLGFLGYPYGIIGYTQYLFLPLVRLSSLTSVWGVSLLVVFPSAWLGYALRDGWHGWDALGSFFVRNRTALLVWVALFVGALGYGLATKVDYSQAPTWRAALERLKQRGAWFAARPAG